MERAPTGYICPFCEWLTGRETEYKKNSDIVYQNETITAFISPKWWETNPGHIIVIPNTHYESLSDIPEVLLGEVYAIAKRISIALKQAYNCNITSTRQHDPHGANDVWHFHTHVFPRYPDDRLYQNHDKKYYAPPEERQAYAEKVRKYL